MPDRLAGTVEQVLRTAAHQIDGDTAHLDARLLLMHVLGCSHEQLVTDSRRALLQDELDAMEALVQRRVKHEPVSQIIQQKEFWGLNFRVTTDVLTPRPDSESLIELALESIKRPPGTILDIGTGTGCLLAALLTEFPKATGIGVDMSDAALAVARENLQRLGLGTRTSLVQGDFASAISGPFDLIISNPPYISEQDEAILPMEVSLYEPREALFAGDGYEAYREISAQIPALIAENGFAVLEVGQRQEATVRELLRDAFDGARQYCEFTFREDLAGIVRGVAVKNVGKKSLN